MDDDLLESFRFGGNAGLLMKDGWLIGKILFSESRGEINYVGTRIDRIQHAPPEEKICF